MIWGKSKAVLGATLLGIAASLAAASDPAVLVEQIDGATLDYDRALRVTALRVDTGRGTLTLHDGVLFPATAVGGRVVELVFLGDATLHVEPPDPVEAGQLELFTGAAVLDERLTEAVLVVAFDEAADAMLAQPPAGEVDPAVRTRAVQLFHEWKAGPERKLLDVRAGIFQDALGDPSYAHYFVGRFRSERLGTFLLVADPDDDEQITLGRFVPLAGTDREQRKRRRYIHRQRRKGRLIGVELEDLGIWDTWMSTTLADAEGRPYRGASPFEPEHYRLDVTVDDKALSIDGTAGIRVRAMTDGRRVVKLATVPELTIGSVRLADGPELFTLREQGSTYAVLPRVPPRDETFELEIEFGGVMIDRIETKVYRLRETMAWYPHVGARDRATYEATFHWPRDLDLLASGRAVDGGKEPKHRRWERRVLDLPASAFSFEIGQYDVNRMIVGHVDVDVAFDRDSQRASSRVEQQVMRAVRSSLRFYEETFGPYPLDHLTVVTAPREFSQGLLSFVTLSSMLLHDPYQSYWLGIEDRRTVIAHEIAHQWWGNLVGWESYRDEWISEAMASFSAVTWARSRLHSARPTVGPADQWQSILAQSTLDGRPVESLGPLVLGRRLSSSRSLDAYEAIVYKKGVVVLNMLDQYFGERLFLRLLREVVRRAGGDVVSTDDLLRILAEASRSEIDWFAEQYVYKTGLPEVYYSYEFEQLDDGKWRIEGAVRQRTPYRYAYRVERTADGGFDIRRRAYEQIDVSESRLVVPVQIAVYNPGTSPGFTTAKVRKRQAEKNKDRPANSTLVGRLLQRSERFEFSLVVDYEPKDFWLDREGMVFGRFFSEHQSPKRAMLYQGFDHAARGDLQAAEDSFLRALEAAVTPEQPEGNSLDAFLVGWEQRYLDATIHTNLAWIYMDQGRLEDAREEIRLARRTPHSFTRARIEDALTLLDSRYEILLGEYEQAFKRLRRDMLPEGTPGRTEAWLLYGIAAQAIGNREELERAAQTLSQRGVDVSILTSAENR
jgi:tetratricopeptide (TPR) repeat protein